MSKRRHHYIPEILCKRFTKDWRIFFRLDCYNKDPGAIAISIKDAFVQKDLNTINIAGTKRTDFIEDFLDKFYEKTYGKSINKVFMILFENAKDKILEPQDISNILDFCILSHLRTPKSLREIHIQTLHRSYLFSIFAKSKDELPIVTNDYILTMTLFEGVNMIRKTIQKIAFSVAYHTFDDEYFLLPDQPIALVNSYDVAFASPDLEIVLPVSNNVVIIFSKTKKVGEITHIQRRETIENINKQLCISINRYIACADKKYLEDFVSRNDIVLETIPEINEIEAERDKIIDNIKKELEKNPKGRYIRINKYGIEFLN